MAILESDQPTPQQQTDLDRQLGIFAAITVARCANALDRAGLLTADDRASIRGQLGEVAKRAEAIPNHIQLVWLDLLVSLLPPPRPGD